jgi:signal transduction histidine kinase
MTVTLAPAADPLLPLWRAAQVFRVASLVYAVGVLANRQNPIDQVPLAWALRGAQVVWTGLAVTLLSTTRDRRSVVVGDLVVTLALVFSSWAVASHASWTHQDVLPTMLWAANAVASAALQWGRRVGIVAALVVALAGNAVTSDLGTSIWVNGTIPLLLVLGLTTGTLARVVLHADEQLRAAVELRAATEERERLARSVHDGALQVLALVARMGGRIEPDLAREAGTQEAALRHLLGATGSERSGQVDVAGALTALSGPAVSVSAPQEAVLMSAARGAELVAAVREALANVTRHAGAGARAWVLVEDLHDDVVVSVRDDGPGIPDGRLAEATSSGRLGISQSIRGRIAALGGSATLETADGGGTEWELRVPRLDTVAR